MDAFIISLAIPALMAVEGDLPEFDASAWTGPAPVVETRDEYRSSCDRGGGQLCYDAATGKVVYRKTRDYMPALPGLKAEHISLRKSRITWKYSFR